MKTSRRELSSFHIVAAFILSFSGAIVSARPVPTLWLDQKCDTANDDRRWLTEALAGWNRVLRDDLKARIESLPQIVTFDGRCTYTLTTVSSERSYWTVTPHRGEIALPNGSKIPPGPNAFNAEGRDGRNFVVISLPSVWRPFAPKSPVPLEWFLEGVLLHELAHSHQSSVTPQMSFPSLLKTNRLPAEINDDTVQEVFRSNPGYVRAYEAERDRLFRAASATNAWESRSLACQSLALLRARRTRYFVGSNSYLNSVDELALTTEGLGQWVSYRWLTKRRGVARPLALQKLRGPYWSQDEGLALFLTIDRLVPRWQAKLFARRPAKIEQLLSSACKR